MMTIGSVYKKKHKFLHTCRCVSIIAMLVLSIYIVFNDGRLNTVIAIMIILLFCFTLLPDLYREWRVPYIYDFSDNKLKIYYYSLFDNGVKEYDYSQLYFVFAQNHHSIFLLRESDYSKINKSFMNCIFCTNVLVKNQWSKDDIERIQATLTNLGIPFETL